MDDKLFTTRWLHCFIERHPNLTRRRAEPLDRLRSRSFNTQTIDHYFFNQLKLAFERCQELSGGQQLTANLIFAMDETSLSPNLKKDYIIAQNGTRNVRVLTSEDRSHLTVVGCVAAKGWLSHPFSIVPCGKRPIPWEQLLKVVLSKKVLQDTRMTIFSFNGANLL